MSFAEKMNFDEEELEVLNKVTRQNFYCTEYKDLRYDEQVEMYELAMNLCLMP